MDLPLSFLKKKQKQHQDAFINSLHLTQTNPASIGSPNGTTTYNGGMGERGCHTIEIEKQFFLRMKCVLAKRNAGLTSSGYKVRFYKFFVVVWLNIKTIINYFLFPLGYSLLWLFESPHISRLWRWSRWLHTKFRPCCCRSFTTHLGYNGNQIASKYVYV